jgi:hypothetical protein
MMSVTYIIAHLIYYKNGNGYALITPKKKYEFQNIEREEFIPKKIRRRFPKQKLTPCQ